MAHPTLYVVTVTKMVCASVSKIFAHAPLALMITKMIVLTFRKLGKIENLSSLGKIGNLDSLGKIGNLGSLGNLGNLRKIGKIGSLGRLGKMGNLSRIREELV